MQRLQSQKGPPLDGKFVLFAQYSKAFEAVISGCAPEYISRNCAFAMKNDEGQVRKGEGGGGGGKGEEIM